MISAIVIIVLTTSLFVYTVFVFKKDIPDNQEEFEKMKRENAKVVVAKTIKLKKMIINLRSKRNRLRFLEIVIHLVPFKKHQSPLIEQQRPLIRDAIIDIAGRMEPQELNTLAGKIILENRVKERINKKFDKPHIRELFFSRFVVQ